MEIKINFNTVTEEISRSLSIIGKRGADENGNSLYEKVTFGSNEAPIINDFIRSAVLRIQYVMLRFLLRSVDEGSSMTLVYELPSGRFFASVNEKALQEAAGKYVVSHALARWFSIVMPSLTEFYVSDASMQLQNLSSMIYEERPSHADVSLSSINNR